jgi:transcriptional regulator with XRE-family HTH domain
MEPVPIGRKILLTRTEQYRTAAGVSKAAGVNPHTLSRIERGGGVPRYSTVAKIARALEMPVEELIEGTDLDRTAYPKARAPRVPA